MAIMRTHDFFYGIAEESSERDEAQGAWSAATGTYRVDRRGSENEVSAKTHIVEADLKRSGRSQHRATQRFARAAIYSAFPYASAPGNTRGDLIGNRRARWANPLFAIAACITVAVFAVLPAQTSAQLRQPFVWELSKAGSNRTVTLLGSLHVGKADFYPLPEAVQKRFEAARVLAVEADILLPTTQQICDRLARTDIPLERQLPPEEFAALNAYVRASAIPARAIEGKKLWMVNLVLTAVELAQLGIDFNRGVDIVLLNAARDSGKRIVEVEGAAKQCGSLAQASDAESVAAFNRFITTVRENRMEKRLNALIDHYRAGDGARLLEVIDDEFGASPLGRRARSRLFDERHPHMADAIADYFDKPEPHFVVIGVGHMLGNSNLLDALAKKGITARRIAQ